MGGTTMDKLDLYREHKADYVAPRRPTLVDIGPAAYLAIDGRGAPGDASFQDAITALYGVAYTLKFASKAAGRDFTVCKLEVLYDREEPGASTPVSWTMMIRVPSFVVESDLHAACATLREKGKPGRFDAVTLTHLEEGRCVQVLHVGPYEAVPDTISQMDAFATEHGLVARGRRHEIYLSDPRRVPPDRLRTILRQPVAPAARRDA